MLLEFLLPLAVLTVFSGCMGKVNLYPIEQSDIVVLQEGEDLKAPKSGAFLSDEYIKEVMQARIGK